MMNRTYRRVADRRAAPSDWLATTQMAASIPLSECLA
jgi:hypothetical protein